MATPTTPAHSTPPATTSASPVVTTPLPDGQTAFPFAAASITVSQNTKGFTMEARRCPNDNTDSAMRKTLVELWRLSIAFRALFPNNPAGEPSLEELDKAGFMPVNSPSFIESMLRHLDANEA